MVFKPVVNIIRRRTRDEWRDFFNFRLTSVRMYIQENGEKSALVALVLGVSIVLFFKVFVVIACLLALWILLVFILSERDPLA